MFCHEQDNYYENKIDLPNLKANKEKGGAFMSQSNKLLACYVMSNT